MEIFDPAEFEKRYVYAEFAWLGTMATMVLIIFAQWNFQMYLIAGVVFVACIAFIIRKRRDKAKEQRPELERLARRGRSALRWRLIGQLASDTGFPFLGAMIWFGVALYTGHSVLLTVPFFAILTLAALLRWTIYESWVLRTAKPHHPIPEAPQPITLPAGDDTELDETKLNGASQGARTSVRNPYPGL